MPKRAIFDQKTTPTSAKATPGPTTCKSVVCDRFADHFLAKAHNRRWSVRNAIGFKNGHLESAKSHLRSFNADKIGPGGTGSREADCCTRRAQCSRRDR